MDKLLSSAEISLNKEFQNIDQTIPESMTLLDKLVKKHVDQKPFKGITALLIQHQFGNQYPQTKALIELGLDPEKLWWLDIPYTSNAEFRSRLEDLHIPAKNLIVNNYRLLEAYAPYQLQRVQVMIRQLINENPEHLLVLDDGCYFLEALSSMKTTFKRISIVEQTSRGIFKINENSVLKYYSKKMPVINVARSEPKMTLEPPFIGRSVCRSLQLRLEPYLDEKRMSPVLVIGFGAIGRSVAESLTEYLNISPSEIYVFDKKLKRQAEAKKRGFPKWNKNDFNARFRLVIGCTGYSSFKCGDYIYLQDKAILASASSGTVELSRQDFIELADCSQFDDLEVIREGLDEKNLHSDIKFRLVDGEAIFLNGGFPINFSGGHMNCIPIKYMEPTATMMVSAAIQAVTTGGKGLIRLNKKFCEELEKDFRVLLGHEAAVLS